jgi:hypothetical protein
MKSPKTDFEFKNFEVEVDDEEGDVTMHSTPEKIGYLKDYPVDKYPASIDRNYNIQLSKLKDEIFNNSNITSMPFIDAKSIVLYMPKNTTQGWYDKKAPYFDADSPPTSERKLTGYVYLNFSKSFKHLDYENKSRVIAQIKQLDKNWDFYMKRLSQILDLTVKGEVEKRNKIFAGKPKVPQIKPDASQTRIKFEDFIKNKERNRDKL